MAKTVKAQSGHTLALVPVSKDQLPLKMDGFSDYERFYEVRNFDEQGCLFMWLGRGHEHAPNQWVVWYRNGKMWSSYGDTIKEALDGAQRDGWMYAE